MTIRPALVLSALSCVVACSTSNAHVACPALICGDEASIVVDFASPSDLTRLVIVACRNDACWSSAPIDGGSVTWPADGGVTVDGGSYYPGEAGGDRTTYVLLGPNPEPSSASLATLDGGRVEATISLRFGYRNQAGLADGDTYTLHIDDPVSGVVVADARWTATYTKVDPNGPGCDDGSHCMQATLRQSL